MPGTSHLEASTLNRVRRSFVRAGWENSDTHEVNELAKEFFTEDLAPPSVKLQLASK